MTTQALSFDVLLARELACAFAAATGLGCTVNTADSGDTLCAFGDTCERCALCEALGRRADVCDRTHAYGMAQAERFGGQYIYFCKRGLTFFVSPIIGRERSEARITVGPFIMVDAEDFCACELGGDTRHAPLVAALPFVPPDKVTRLSTLLFMAVGYLNSVAAVEAMREQKAVDAIQGQISAYILEVKSAEPPSGYPYDKERALLRAIVEGERGAAHRLLNELLGHVLVTSGASFPHVKAQINALLVMMTRAVVEQSSDTRRLEQQTFAYFQELQGLGDMPQLCLWLTDVTNELMASVFAYQDARHADAIHRSIQYMRAHLGDRLELEELARAAYLSPAYFSRVFKEETGQTVRETVMRLRLQKAAELIRYDTLKLADIASMVGFEDQSYFSRAFQRAYGVPPSRYRQKNARKQP